VLVLLSLVTTTGIASQGWTERLVFVLKNDGHSVGAPGPVLCCRIGR